MAVDVERRLSTRVVDGADRFRRAWQAAVETGAVSLVDLCRNAGFWNAYRVDLPVYEAAGAFVGYLIERHGTPTLRRVFEETHYEDTELAAKLERHLGLGIVAVQADVARYLAAGP